MLPLPLPTHRPHTMVCLCLPPPQPCNADLCPPSSGFVAPCVRVGDSCARHARTRSVLEGCATHAHRATHSNSLPSTSGSGRQQQTMHSRQYGADRGSGPGSFAKRLVAVDPVKVRSSTGCRRILQVPPCSASLWPGYPCGIALALARWGHILFFTPDQRGASAPY